MKNFESNRMRCIALAGHGGSGKTSMGDAIARLTGLNSRLGSVSDKSSVLDFEPEEQDRGGSITSSFLTCEFDGYKISLVDTPGDGDFMHDGLVALQAVDGVCLVVAANDGIQTVTEKANARAIELGVPRAVFVNKLDRERADHSAVVSDIKELLGAEPVLLQLPIGKESDFRGVVDLISRQALIYDGDGGTPSIEAIPADMEAEVEEALEMMTEAVAMTDDALVEKYLETMELSHDELRYGLNKGIMSGRIIPVILGSATKNIGVDRVLWLSRAFPSPEERVFPLADGGELRGSADGSFVGLCFKTIIDPFMGHLSVVRCLRGTLSTDVHPTNGRASQNERCSALFYLNGKKNVSIDRVVAGDIFAVPKLKHTQTGDTLYVQDAVNVAWHPAPPPMISNVLKPKTRADEDKVRGALDRILAEDSGLQQSFDEVTKEIVISGMGANHIALSVARMARKYGVKVDLGKPTIPYRETISGTADVRYRHKKQSGGAGQFGEVAIRIRPAERGEGFVFENCTVGGVIPNTLIPSVEKGVRIQLEKGILAGFPVIDVRCELYDGKSHPVDSKDIAFQIAGRQAIKKAVMDARPTLLEPIYLVEVVVPEDNVGDIMGDMNTRRGRIQSMEGRGRNSVVKAFVPLSEMLEYAPTLKSVTGGKGSYSMEFHTFEAVPSNMQAKLVASINRLQAEEE